MRVDLAMFAHNEAGGIADTLADLARQTVFGDPGIDLRVLVLANGCEDATVAQANAARARMPADVADRVEVHDLPEGGKSRTVQRYIHQMSRSDAEVLGFMDADISLPRTDALGKMLAELAARPDLHAFSSRPVKDVDYHDLQVGPVARLIASGGGGLTDFRRSICGQLYVLRGQMARKVVLPVGLPVEDGFVRAMVVTDLFSHADDLNRIDGDPDVLHVYESIQSVGELLRHQTRIVLGSAINAALYARFRTERLSGDALRTYLLTHAQDPRWLPDVLARDLPRAPFGFVPFRFATKRWHAFHRRAGRSVRAYAVLMIGLVMDMLVWVLASWRMARGQGAGFW